MSILDKFSKLIPFGKKEEILEYFFALNIEAENLTAALWTIEKKELKILEAASDTYKNIEEIIQVSDKLLDSVLGTRAIEPQKILFGVPDSWLHEENLKEEYLKLLRNLVKEFELTPMAYVATSHALVHFLEKKEDVPTTAILLGLQENHITATVVRAGKLDGTKVVERGDNLGVDVEKALLTFTAVETLPSKILIYGKDREKLSKEKGELLSFPWMSRLSFLHLPKIEVLDQELEISSICLAGAFELDGSIVFKKVAGKIKGQNIEEEELKKDFEDSQENFGFKVEGTPQQEEISEQLVKQKSIAAEDSNVLVPEKESESRHSVDLFIKKFIPKRNLANILVVGSLVLGFIVLLGVYLFLPKAQVLVFVEPRILERDAQVTADPNIKEIDEVNKIIPAQVIETEVSGTQKEESTGKKQIGDPAKGVIKIYNATSQRVQVSLGTSLTTDSNISFSLEESLEIASKSASAAAPSAESRSVKVTAKKVGPDGNIPSGTELRIGNFSKSDVVAKAEGNFSGGTSKEVTVVSEEDQKRLLAKLTSSLRVQAQQKLQERLKDKKIPQEGLSEEILKKSYSKNINDLAGEFSLNLSAKYKGSAFDEKDLKTFVSKLITTEVPEGFELNLDNTETQSDISSLEKDGRLIFLTRFKAKLMPKVDKAQVRAKIRGKTPGEAISLLKKIEHVLDAQITFSPNFPKILQRLPLLDKNISVEVGLK